MSEEKSALDGRGLLAAMLAVAVIAGSCGRRGAPDVRIEIDGTFANATLPSGAWSPDGRAFTVRRPGRKLAIGRLADWPASPRLVIEQPVADHVWSPSGLRLACRIESRRTILGISTYDVVVAEHDTVGSTPVEDRDVWGLVWLSDTSLWARQGPDGALVRVASFPVDSIARGTSARRTTTGFNVILPPRPAWRQLPTLLVGVLETMPAGSLEIPGAPGFAQLEIHAGTWFRSHASNAATRRFLGWYMDKAGEDALLDSAGTFVRLVSTDGQPGFTALDFSSDGTIVFGRRQDHSQEGRATSPMVVAADGSWPPVRVKGPPIGDLQVSPRGDRVLLTVARGVSVGRVVIKR